MRKTFMLFMIFWAMSLCLNAQDTNSSIIRDIPYYDSKILQSDNYINERCKLDLFVPKNAKDLPTMIWFHGGGITGGNKEIPKELMGGKYIVVGVNYRLSPKVQCPAYIEDAAAATAWVFNHITQYGGNVGRIFITGHSAGGYLASMVVLDESYLEKYKIDANKVAGLIPFSGHTITHMTVREERSIKNTQPIVDQYAPLYHARGDAPPLLLITGDREMEMLGRYEENAYMMRVMKLNGHKNTTLYEMDGYGHSMTTPAFPLLMKFVDEIVKNDHK